MNWLILISIVASVLMALRVFRKQIGKWLVKINASLKIRSLRQAISEADDNKDNTGRKTIVVYNATSGEYETIEKKILKKASYSNRNKNNAKLTPGRKKFKKDKTRAFSDERVKTIEKKSLYVTN